MEKKMNARLSNDENGGTLLKKRLEEMEKEKNQHFHSLKYLLDPLIFHVLH
jgi:hypothetical protein